MNYCLYLLNVICASGQSAMGKRYALKGGKSEYFNINKAFSGLLVFLIIGIFGGLTLHIPTILLGIACGFVLSATNHTGFKALSTGSIALTSTIVSFSLIIPFAFGIVVLHEKISPYGVLGISLLCISLAMLNLQRGIKISAKWITYTILTLVFNGIFSVIQKYHQIRFPNQYRIEFLITALLVVLITTFVFSRKKSIKVRVPISFNGITAGIMNGLSNYIVLYLSATENASVLFPIVSVAQIITTCFIGRIAFSEKLRCMQICGIMFGVTSIVLLNIK